MNVLEIIQSASAYLAKHGVESPRLQAEHLLAHVLRCRRMDLYLQFDRPVSEAERVPLRELVRERAARKPLQHLLAEWDFYGRTFHVDSRALIPRSETEQLVELVLQTLPETARRVVDVGTGSGIIAISLALERPRWTIEGWDISEAALHLAQQNAARWPTENLQFFQGDLLEGAAAANMAYDTIVANLPYIPSGEIAALEPEVRHDPLLALDGGPDGLALIRRLVSQAKSVLEPGGWIFLEIGQGQANAVENLFPAPEWEEVASALDFRDIRRFVRARRAAA